jgi:signal transduction histidine kinase
MKNYNKGGYKDLYNKIKFTVTFRILVFSIIILTYIIINFNGIIHYAVFIYAYIATAIFLTSLYWAVLFYLKNKSSYKWIFYFGLIQLFADFAVISSIVLFNGGLDDKFIFLYYLLILVSGFIFLKSGVMISGIASAIAIGLSSDLQYYFDIGRHLYFLYNPDKLLFLTSTNILGVLIFSWLLYRFSGELGILSAKIIEKEEFIKESQNFNRELFNSFSQGVIVIGENYEIIFLNAAAAVMLNLNSINKEFMDKSGILHKFKVKISDIFENFPVNVLEEKNEAGSLRRFELNHKDAVLGFALTELKSGEYYAGGSILLFRDITYLKQLELESKINEGLATAGKLAGWLAHEIRNPLAAINTSVYVLSSENVDCRENDYKRLIDIITTEVHKLDNLVNDFLGFVKVKSRTIGGGNFEKINLFLFAQALISGYAVNNAKIHNSINKNVEIFSEKSRIAQVISNIIQNALQSIEIKLSAQENKKTESGIIRLGSRKIKNAGGRDYISISVSDNGSGMDDFTQKNAFKPLFTTKENGTGLGLSIVYSIMESLGGKTQIISRAGKGTLIKISIPL